MKTRIQFELNEAQNQMLLDLMGLVGAETRKELFNTALTTLRWAASKAMEGKTIGALDEGTQTYREFSTPALDHAQQIGRSNAHVEHTKVES